MSEAEALEIARDGLWTLIKMASPLMLVALAAGGAMALFQKFSRIPEMTLAFVPRILAVFLAMLVALPLMAQSLDGYMARIAHYIAAG